MSKIIYHNHHIIPRHAGGTDDPSNLIRLTIPDHAEAHRVLWEQHGRWQDKNAWKLLQSLMGDGELFRRMKLQRPKTKKYKPTDEHKARISAAHVGKSPSHETKRKISKTLTGTTRPIEIKLKISNALKGKPTWSKGKTLPMETRLKMSRARLGRVVSDETREKIRQSQLRRRQVD